MFHSALAPRIGALWKHRGMQADPIRAKYSWFLWKRVSVSDAVARTLALKGKARVPTSLLLGSPFTLHLHDWVGASVAVNLHPSPLNGLTAPSFPSPPSACRVRKWLPHNPQGDISWTWNLEAKSCTQNTHYTHSSQGEGLACLHKSTIPRTSKKKTSL